MWPGFDSRTRRQMWVEFVVGSRPCSERFFSGYSGFPLSSKTNTSKFQLTLKSPERDEPIKYVFILFIYDTIRYDTKQYNTSDKQKVKGGRSMLSILGSLSFVMSSAPAKKSAGDARHASQDPSIRGNQRCPIESRLQSVLGVRSSYVERNNTIRDNTKQCNTMH